MMTARIRPSLDDDTILHRISLDPFIDPPPPVAISSVPEITPCIEEQSPRRNQNHAYVNSEDCFRDFLLKRSYSFGFERSVASERMVMEATTASPWRYRRGSNSLKGVVLIRQRLESVTVIFVKERGERTLISDYCFLVEIATSAMDYSDYKSWKSTCCRVAVLAAISFVITEANIVSGTLFFPRRVFGYIFSNEKEVVDYVTAMAPQVCVSVTLDSIQSVPLTGDGNIYVNLEAFRLWDSCCCLAGIFG
ncbi:hypothetical protein LR48_Vigan609s001200 [Vigna angularis]|uniref:Uncharacterized protein n=1 Tax=Phaseolus angularis TaxID=3914 RepID=A0A0L9TE52_PHAAN|nr:hypothetical protein LR48_Vigan609s001200 [Vigna angularis]